MSRQACRRLTTAAAAPRLAALSSSEPADVVVVGAGVVGLAFAARAAELLTQVRVSL